MKRGFVRRLACMLFGCDLSLIESFSAPPNRLVLICSRCLFCFTIRPGEELRDELARDQAKKMARNFVPWLN